MGLRTERGRATGAGLSAAPRADSVGLLYGLNEDDGGPSAREIWDYWLGEWRARIVDGRDLVIVIDADRTEGATRIGKSTLGARILRRLDPSFKASTIAARCAAGPAELAKKVVDCKPGQGFLYDEAMWGARGRDAMSPEGKMIGEILGTLASRQAIVIFCCHSMVSLDPEVKALAAYRLIVRTRGLAEVHTPTVQLDLERPRLLPFREHTMSPLLWPALGGPLWAAYERWKHESQDRRVKLKLQEQLVYERRRLGLPARDPETEPPLTAGDNPGPRAPAPREFACAKCARPFGSRYGRDRHQVSCRSAPAATPLPAGAT
jgi:hypothetical protein